MGKKVRVAIIGVGNCASSLVQGVEFYKNASETERVPGLMHVNLGGYHIRDIEFTAAFDVNAEKVGKDLGEAVSPDCDEKQNCECYTEHDDDFREYIKLFEIVK